VSRWANAVHDRRTPTNPIWCLLPTTGNHHRLHRNANECPIGTGVSYVVGEDPTVSANVDDIHRRPGVQTGPAASFRIGRRVMYRRTDVEEWINAQQHQSTHIATNA